MKHFTTLWLDTPRWVRGLFLGNLSYIGLVELAFCLERVLTYVAHAPSETLLFIFPIIPLFPIMKAPPNLCLPMPHVLWCVFGTLLVYLFGEKKGMNLLIILMYALGIAFLMYKRID